MTPRVEDMTGFDMDGPCRHTVVFFGSKGRVIICAECSQMWEATTPNFVEIDLTDQDKRVEPAPEEET